MATPVCGDQHHRSNSPLACLEQPTLVARLSPQFWDLGFEPGDARAVFDVEAARAVLRFVESECGRATMLVVHCEAGTAAPLGSPTRSAESIELTCDTRTLHLPSRIRW